MNEALWYVSRATGIVSIVLLTGIFVMGMVTVARRFEVVTSTVLTGLHRSLSLGMAAFLAAHVTTGIAETYVDIDWISAVVPFTSGFSRGYVGMGTLALDCVVAVIVTSIMRHRLSEETWKRIHGLTYLMWGFAIIHGVGLGTANEPLLRDTTIACGVIGFAAMVWRRLFGDPHEEVRQQIASQEWM